MLGVPSTCPSLSAKFYMSISKTYASRHPFPEAMAPPGPIGPFKLVTVNTAPDRAKRLIGRIVEDVKDKYTIIHAANATGNTGYAQHILWMLTGQV